MNDSAEPSTDDVDRLSTDITRSSRDHDDLQTRLEAWLRGKTRDSAARVSELVVPSGSGMSSETVLFDARWIDGDGSHEESLVARIAPAVEDVPVFPSYDLEMQFRVMKIVADRSRVPVPRPRFLEVDPGPIGSQFFVMDRVNGRVPTDLPPYLFEGWLLAADPTDQRHLQDASVAVLAELHSIDLDGLDTDFLYPRDDGDTLLRRHVNHQRRYYQWTRGERRHPIIEETFIWLDEHWPEETDPVISWGDSRIGNIMFAIDGFDPVAVVDWEMATIGPAELDVAWMIFLHSFFQNIAEVLGLEGMPDFMRRDDVAETYRRARGVDLVDLHWFEVFAALRHAIIMSRIRDRSVRFGEAEWSDDVDEAIPHRDLLRSMIS